MAVFKSSRVELAVPSATAPAETATGLVVVWAGTKLEVLELTVVEVELEELVVGGAEVVVGGGCDVVVGGGTQVVVGTSTLVGVGEGEGEGEGAGAGEEEGEEPPESKSHEP